MNQCKADQCDALVRRLKNRVKNEIRRREQGLRWFLMSQETFWEMMEKTDSQIIIENKNEDVDILLNDPVYQKLSEAYEHYEAQGYYIDRLYYRDEKLYWRGSEMREVLELKREIEERRMTEKEYNHILSRPKEDCLPPRDMMSDRAQKNLSSLC